MVKHQILILYLLYPISGLAFNQDMGLEGQYLTLKELELLKKDRLPEKKELKKALFWHQTFPTTGLRLEKPFYPPSYPFIPHYFSLWQLAPKKGAGIKVAVLDTGVAAYQLENVTDYKKNHDLLVQGLFDNQSLNMVADQGKEPIQHLITLIQKYTDPEKYNAKKVEQEVPQWIKHYLGKRDEKQIRDYLAQYGRTELEKNNRLTKEGEKALADILHGRYGIEPLEHGIAKPFTLVTLTKPKKETVVLEFLPLGKITDKKTTFIAGHGSHTFGIISGQLDKNANIHDDSGIVGLAPDATTFMIKAFHDSGISRKSTLIAAIKKALLHDAQVINCSLKVADSLDFTDESTKMLEDIVDLVPYMVAASGNHGDPKDPHYAGNVEAYPARFSSVPFDVGAFAFKDGKAFIPNFSQYEPNVGPLFLAPGFDILSSGLVPGQQNESTYVFMGGTSVATPIMSGFVALMLAEFHEKFSREQMLKVCYCSTLKLSNDKQWKEKVMLGVLDMRTALFILHALEHYKRALQNKNSTFNIDQNFDAVLKAILALLFDQPQKYAQQYLNSIDFQNNFMEYFNQAHQRNVYPNPKEFYIPEGDNALEKALSYITSKLLEKKFIESDIKLFDNLDPAIEKRIAEKLNPKVQKKNKGSYSKKSLSENQGKLR